MCCFMFFFFKQKTAYEMRISDWSSDVCSSDLDREFHRNGSFDLNAVGAPPAHSEGIGDGHKAARLPAALVQRAVRGVAKQPGDPAGHPRSEEHTSELQSLMRISYAVFCLKKKNKKLRTNNHQINTTVSSILHQKHTTHAHHYTLI